MDSVKSLWRKLTHTKALDQSSGKLETVFFESLYRLAYVTGLSTTDRGKYLLYSNAVKLMILLLVCGEVWFACEETASLDELAASINMAHKDFYKKLATSMESPNFDITTETRKKFVDYWAQTNKKYFNLVLALGNCTLVAWFTFPLLDDVEYNLIVGIRLPFHYKTTLMYPVAYILVIIAFVYIAHFVMVTDLIMQTHLIQLLCQYDVLADCFENLYNDCKIGYEGVIQNDLIYSKSFANKFTDRLGELVQQHRLILSHTMNLRKTLSGPMLGQLAASGTLICFLGYQTTTTLAESPGKFVMSFFFLGYNLFGLYIICNWCEEITNRSLKIGEAAYCSGWECGVTRFPGVRSTLLYVIARANKPLYLTAGGMYNLSLNSYTTLVKTSYSALTVLLRFRHD